MEFSGTAMHVKTLKDSVPLIWLLRPVLLFFLRPILCLLFHFSALVPQMHPVETSNSEITFLSFCLLSYEILKDWDLVLFAVCVSCMTHITGTMVGIAGGLLNSFTSHWNTDRKKNTHFQPGGNTVDVFYIATIHVVSEYQVPCKPF